MGAEGNGGPADDGATFDGLLPFVDGNVTAWQEPYWERVTRYLRLAADNGITVFLYPIDGWTIGHAFRPTTIEQCQAYGTHGRRAVPGPAQHRLDVRRRLLPGKPTTRRRAATSTTASTPSMRGIRAAGDDRPFSIQLGYPKSISTDNPYWADRVTWNFVYTYLPTYAAVLQAYARTPTIPAIFGEGNYERENNDAETPATTNQTLRRQMLWALTSGAAGAFYGSDDWEFHDGWEQRLDTEAVAQLGRLHEELSQLPWWTPRSGHRPTLGHRRSRYRTH